MKYSALARLLRKSGWYLKREGCGHEIWANGREQVSIPRHKEINEQTAKAIIKKCGLN